MFDTFNSSAPSAKVTDGRLILTLTDAETPALWMMDLNDAATAVLRLENDRHGLFVIKKHGGKGPAETIAVYRDRRLAAHALQMASKALEKARDTRHQMVNGRPIIVRPGSRIARFMTILLLFWFVLYLMGLDTYIVRTIFEPAQPQLAVSEDLLMPPALTSPAPAAASTRQAAPPPIQAGVPLSADDYLLNQVNQIPMQ